MQARCGTGVLGKLGAAGLSGGEAAGPAVPGPSEQRMDEGNRDGDEAGRATERNGVEDGDGRARKRKVGGRE